ncbi:unnamed protein product [Toxocara canis]|uniref:ERF1_3 domain-containing protein n=1 Tax=Toxocara canis TaxID=6265 RepID=A0A183V0B6_TOXCA|nr:unnamed protein product [Toxocara canis]
MERLEKNKLTVERAREEHITEPIKILMTSRRHIVAIREPDRNDSLNVLSEKGLPAAICNFNRSDSLIHNDRRIVEEWTRVTEKEELIFDAPPLPGISEERLQWVLGMVEKNHQAREQSAEEKGKSMVDSVREDAEEIIEAASEAIEKSSVFILSIGMTQM